MNKLYFILAVAGWAWLIVVALFLVLRLGMKRTAPRGFDVVRTPADDPPPREGTSGGGATER